MYNYLLDTFIVVVKTGSFTKASEELFISSTSIMKQMNKLENDLHLKLFQRTPQGVELMLQGKYIYKKATELIYLSHNIIHEARELSQEKTIKIKIGTSELFSSKILSDLWNDIQINHPEFDLEFVSFEDSVQGQLHTFSQLGNKYTLLLGTYLSSFMSTKYNTMMLTMLPICIGVPVHNKLYHHEILKISDLYNQKIMMLKRGLSQYLDNARNELEKHKDITIIDTDEYDINTFHQCIKRNMIMITSPNWKDVHPMIKTIPVDWDCQLSYGIIYSLHPSDETLQFINILVENFNLKKK